MEIRSLAGIGHGKIFAAFSRAFADYEMQLDSIQFAAMLRRRGFDPELSFAAFDGEEIVAFTLNGIGRYGGLPTAYDTGTGTVKEYRGRGLATAIFEYSLPYLRGTGIRQYLLEVLQHNTKAVSVYRNLGFGVTREFNYFRQENAAVRNDVPDHGGRFTVRPIDPANPGAVAGFRDFRPSWQNSTESVRRAAADFVGLGAFRGEVLAGYCIFEPASGDVAQLAVDRPFRRQGAASLLLREILRLNRCDGIKVINTETSSLSVTGFLESKNILPAGRQFEMVRTI
ncbi:MAG: GNAT family N-acetyltransferase [Rikenellaceae bacterium]|nr:GNAT family N-acetyltransferase [Rikenellaceae bacterium]